MLDTVEGFARGPRWSIDSRKSSKKMFDRFEDFMREKTVEMIESVLESFGGFAREKMDGVVECFMARVVECFEDFAQDKNGRHRKLFEENKGLSGLKVHVLARFCTLNGPSCLKVCCVRICGNVGGRPPTRAGVQCASEDSCGCPACNSRQPSRSGKARARCRAEDRGATFKP